MKLHYNFVIRKTYDVVVAVGRVWQCQWQCQIHLSASVAAAVPVAVTSVSSGYCTSQYAGLRAPDQSASCGQQLTCIDYCSILE